MILPTKEEFRAALAKTERLIPAPRTLSRALQLLRDPDSGLSEIADLIRCDSALAVDMLRCANSAFYSRPERITDVSDAVQLIGFRETIRLINLVTARQTTDRNLGSYGIAAEDFWAESLFNGLFFETLACRVPDIDAGDAYTAGLLRFIGRLAIDQALHDFGGSLFWDGSTPLAEWERENVGLTQAEVGAGLLRKWEFPEHIFQAIAAQDLAAPPDAATAHPLVLAMHFATQVLPAGGSLASINALVASASSGAENHPFATAHALTPLDIGKVLEETFATFVSIRETLYT